MYTYGTLTRTLAGFMLLGLLHGARAFAQSPSFEVASVKLNKSGDRSTYIRMPAGRFTITNMVLSGLVQFAYDVKNFQVSGAPGWVSAERYDIDAKIDDATGERMQKAPFEERQKLTGLMLQALLVERFQLSVSHETKQMPVYALLVAKNGSKLQQTALTPDELNPHGPPQPKQKGPMFMINRGEMSMTGVGMSQFADLLGRQLGRIVVDKTELTAKYDFKLKWTPDESAGQGFKGAGDDGKSPDAPPPPDANGPTIFTALQEQLGLRLDSQKGPVDMLVINRIERPTEN